jgi:hypothetical protein
MPVFEVRKDYLLSEAFELIGRRLFADDWNGNEWTITRAKSPEQLRDDRAPNVEKLAHFEANLKEIEDGIRRTTNATAIARLKRKRAAAFERRNKVGQALLSLPEPTEFHEWQYATYLRRQKAEELLVDSLRRGVFKAHNGRGYVIDNVLWNGHPGFVYSIELSAVRLPRALSSKRFEAARIPEGEFDRWLETLPPLTESAEAALPPIERCRSYLKRQVEAGPQAKSKAEYLAEAQSLIPKLTEVDFESVWKEGASDEWKQPGRRRWGKETPDKVSEPEGV